MESNAPVVALLLGLLVLVLIIAVPFWLFWQRLQGEWRGTVTDKTIRHKHKNTSQDPARSQLQQSSPEHLLLVLTKTNKQILFKVSAGVYETFKIGDAIAKKAGTLVPHKPLNTDLTAQ